MPTLKQWLGLLKLFILLAMVGAVAWKYVLGLYGIWSKPLVEYCLRDVWTVVSLPWSLRFGWWLGTISYKLHHG